jgi:hypothetical protein
LADRDKWKDFEVGREFCYTRTGTSFMYVKLFDSLAAGLY